MNYCLGFAFSRDLTRVMLIRKLRPAWQAGRLNGIGGKLEAGETALEAMVRECREETGLDISDWEYFATIQSAQFTVTCYKTCTDEIFRAQSLTDENVVVEEVDLQRFFREGNPSVAPLIAHALRPDSGTITVPHPGDVTLKLSTLVPMSYELRAPDIHGDNQVLMDRVRRRGNPDAWVIRREGRALTMEGAWEYEGRPFTSEFLARTRFDSEAAALSAWGAYQAQSTDLPAHLGEGACHA